MVEKPDYVLNFVRPANTEIKYIRGHAHPFSPLVNIIYSADFHNIIQNRINALLPCPAWNQPLFSYASKYFPRLFS